VAKKVESRAEQHLKAYERYFALMEEAQEKGDMSRLLRNMEYAIESWMGYTEAAVSKTIRDGRERQLSKLIEWYEAIKDQDEAPPPPEDAGGDAASGAARPKSSGRRKAKEGKDDAQAFIPVEKPTLCFADIAGLDDVKEDIRLKMIYPYTHPEEAERYKIRRGGGILLWGPPGTGKTMMARAVAGEIDAAFFTVKPSEIMSKWVGDSEQNIERLFKAAREHERSIIFIDEIEAMIPSRRESQSPVMSRLVPQILAELEGFDSASKNPLLFIGATNEPWSLDPAVLRPGRFDEKVYVGLPDPAARKKILELNLAGRPVAEDVDFDVLAEKCAGYSGADVKNICEKAAADVFLKAVKHNDGGEPPPIALADLVQVLAETRPSVTPAALEEFHTYRDSNWAGSQSGASEKSS
jgi:transitional endoplasmic reticulum ATPase